MRTLPPFAPALLSALLAAGPAFAPGPARAGDQFDAALCERDLRQTLEEKPSCIVLYHVGRDSFRKGKLDTLMGKLRSAAARETLFYRVDIGLFTGAARDQVVRDLGRNEFPSVALYHFGGILTRALRPVEYDFDKVVEGFKPFLEQSLAPPPPEEPVEDQPEGEPLGEPAPSCPVAGPEGSPSLPAPGLTPDYPVVLPGEGVPPAGPSPAPSGSPAPAPPP